MKTSLLLAALLSVATLSQAQTAPTPATGSAAPVAGTKNVGNDRADSPQAPGMQVATPASPPARPGSRPASGRKRKKTGLDKPAASTPRE